LSLASQRFGMVNELLKLCAEVWERRKIALQIALNLTNEANEGKELIDGEYCSGESRSEGFCRKAGVQAEGIDGEGSELNSEDQWLRKVKEG
jgi:hypothetical protein